MVSKYVPYGPVEDVIPYLLRRAQENRAVLRGSMDGLVDDRQLILDELKKRLNSVFST
jgi:proline dehydrogenase